MQDSNAWRELATRFKELERETEGRLDALWISSSCDSNGDWHPGGKWQLGGFDNARSEVDFQWAVERGTVLHRGYAGEDSLFYWLDLLRAERPEYVRWLTTSPINPEELDFGKIENVCRASAKYCYKLETAAMEKDRQADQNGTQPATQVIDPAETMPEQVTHQKAPANSTGKTEEERAFFETAKFSKRRGRRPNPERREAIRVAISKHGEQWREHLGEVLAELDSEAVPLGDFQSMKIDLGDGETQVVNKWEDLDLAAKDERARVIDALRKYL